VGWDSSVGIATRYGLDGLGIVSRWGRGAHPASYTVGTGFFGGGYSGRGVALTIHPI